MKRNLYLVATMIIIVLFAVLVCATNVRAGDENEYIEKLEEIDGTKSTLFYFDTTDTFLIYSKKNGQWFEISEKDAEDSMETESGDDEVEEE